LNRQNSATRERHQKIDRSSVHVRTSYSICLEVKMLNVKIITVVLMSRYLLERN